MSRAIRAILFDLDNTLYDARAGLQEIGDRRINEWIMQHLGLSEAEADALRVRTWREYGTTAKGLEAEYGLPPEPLYEYAISRIEVDRYLRRWPELDAMLSRLTADCHVFTNATEVYARKVLAALGVERHFGRIFGIEQNNWICKPNRAIYERILGELGLPAREVAFVEDNAANLAPAAELGMLTILLHHSPASEGEPADLHIRSILELADTLHRFTQSGRSGHGAA